MFFIRHQPSHDGMPFSLDTVKTLALQLLIWRDCADFSRKRRNVSRTLWKLSFLWLLSGCASDGCQTFSPQRATSKPYQIKGVWYYPQQHYELEETGIASYYGGTDGCHGLSTATGEAFDMYQLTAAHKTLPLPSVIQITNLENGRVLKLKVIDRGPFKNDRVLDVSVRAAQLLGFYEKGTAMIQVKSLVEESLCLPENVRAFAKQGRPLSNGHIRLARQQRAPTTSPSLISSAIAASTDAANLDLLISKTATAEAESIEAVLQRSLTVRDPSLETAPYPRNQQRLGYPSPSKTRPS